jgi:hypothetical protein
MGNAYLKNLIIHLCIWSMPAVLLPVSAAAIPKSGGEVDKNGELCDTVLSVFSGRASFYAVKFQGRKTSNGERLDNMMKKRALRVSFSSEYGHGSFFRSATG